MELTTEEILILLQLCFKSKAVAISIKVGTGIDGIGTTVAIGNLKKYKIQKQIA